MRLPSLVLLAVLSSAPAFASSQGDWFASLYTGEGTELRADERVFTLFAIFNALGFDQGPVTRKDPIPRVGYHPVRQVVRGKVIGGDAAARQAADEFFDKHPVSLRKYLAWAVQGGQPPFKDGAKAKDLQDLKGFEAVLAKAWANWKLEETMGSVQGDYRKVAKSYLTGLDAPLTKAKAILKVPENGPQTLLVVNLLDVHDAARGVMADGEVVLVVGPSEKPNIEGALREYAKVTVEPVANAKAAQWAGGAALLKEAQLLGAPEQTVGEYAAALVGQAVALKAVGAGDAAYDASAARGYFGIKEVAKVLDEGKPLDGVLLDALKKAEATRPTKK